jgi:phosphate-selective porin OprO/OprP
MTFKTTTLAAAASLIALNAFAAEAQTAASPAPAADAASLRAELDNLRQQLAVIERKTELKDEASAAKAKENATSKFDENGFSATSADKNFQLRIKGLVQTDARVYFDDGKSAGSTDKFILRRARPIIEATVGKDYDIVLVPEFGDAPTTTPFLLDAYLNAAPFGKGAQVRIGKQRSTIGFEMNQADPKGFFTERALVTQLTTNRDLGISLHGKPFDEVVEYSIGLFNGAPDGASPSYNGDVSDAKSVAGRIYVKPFANGADYALSNLGFGIGADYRDKTGTAGSNTAAGAFNNGLFNYRSDAQQTIYNWETSSFANGASTRVSPHLGWYAGSFGLLAEYVYSENAVTRGARNDTLRNKGWHVGASWVLTGENASYEGVKPSSEHSIYNNGFGAFELVARVSEVNFDTDAFTGNAATRFANGATSASDARAYALGLNWYPSNNLRFSAAYTHTEFDATNPTSAVLRHGEDALLFRAQLSF